MLALYQASEDEWHVDSRRGQYDTGSGAQCRGIGRYQGYGGGIIALAQIHTYGNHHSYCWHPSHGRDNVQGHIAVTGDSCVAAMDGSQTGMEHCSSSNYLWESARTSATLDFK